MRNVLVKLMCILIVVACVVSVTNCVEAGTPPARGSAATSLSGDSGGGGSAGGGSSSEIIKGSFSGSADAEGSVAIKKILSGVLSVVRNVGAVIAVVMLMTIGAKYIIASAGDRADIKKYAMNYVIGALILLGATGILSIIQKLVEESLG